MQRLLADAARRHLDILSAVEVERHLIAKRKGRVYRFSKQVIAVEQTLNSTNMDASGEEARKLAFHVQSTSWNCVREICEKSLRAQPSFDTKRNAMVALVRIGKLILVVKGKSVVADEVRKENHTRPMIERALQQLADRLQPEEAFEMGEWCVSRLIPLYLWGHSFGNLFPGLKNVIETMHSGGTIARPWEQFEDEDTDEEEEDDGEGDHVQEKRDEAKRQKKEDEERWEETEWLMYGGRRTGAR